jgi:hypothetical protein
MQIKMKKSLVAFGKARVAGEVVDCDFDNRDTQYLLVNHYAEVVIDGGSLIDDEELADKVKQQFDGDSDNGDSGNGDDDDESLGALDL